MLSMTHSPPLILAAMDIERRGLQAAVARAGIAADFDTIGVGPGAVIRWSQVHGSALDRSAPRGRRVILAGLAGALSPTLRFGAVHSAREIIDAGAQGARPSARYFPPVAEPRGELLASVDCVCADPAAKRALRDASGATMVDMESAAFAAIASVRGWNWSVLRAISDDAEQELAHWVIGLVHDDGSTNCVAVARTLMHPSRAVVLMHIARAAHRAIDALSSALVARLNRESRSARTLVFGGTFDPPHRVHRDLVARAAALLGCDSIVIVPAGQNPLRLEHRAASNADRLEMTRLAFAGVAGVSIDTRELHREGPSFTVETLRQLAFEQSLGRDDLVLLIGADQAMQFDRWKSWREIDESVATIAVVPRAPHDARELAALLSRTFSALGSDGPRWERAVLPIDPVDLSATQVRARLRARESITDLVCPEVEAFIRVRGLYA